MSQTPQRVEGVQSAIVARVDFRSCGLRTGDGREFEATVGGHLMGRNKALGNAVVVGDRVDVECGRERAVVTRVEPRRNAFSRGAASGRALEQVVAANLDQVVVVASIADPEFRPGFVDRVLCQAEHCGIPARIVINKLDLAPLALVQSVLADYRAAGYAGLAVCAQSGEGIDHLRQACRGLRSLFVGHSGVGKSTLLNALAPSLGLNAGLVNPKTGKGRHTTTAAWLLHPEPDLELIDTPGVRTFALWGITSRDLDQAYPEFRPFLGECRFGDCRHDREPGCALGAALDSGAIASRRHASFLKLRAELIQEEERG